MSDVGSERLQTWGDAEAAYSVHMLHQFMHMCAARCPEEHVSETLEVLQICRHDRGETLGSANSQCVG